jgi:hypothetical protein
MAASVVQVQRMRGESHGQRARLSMSNGGGQALTGLPHDASSVEPGLEVHCMRWYTLRRRTTQQRPVSHGAAREGNVLLAWDCWLTWELQIAVVVDMVPSGVSVNEHNGQPALLRDGPDKDGMGGLSSASELAKVPFGMPDCVEVGLGWASGDPSVGNASGCRDAGGVM